MTPPWSSSVEDSIISLSLLLLNWTPFSDSEGDDDELIEEDLTLTLLELLGVGNLTLKNNPEERKHALIIIRIYEGGKLNNGWMDNIRRRRRIKEEKPLGLGDDDDGFVGMR